MTFLWFKPGAVDRVFTGELCPRFAPKTIHLSSMLEGMTEIVALGCGCHALLFHGLSEFLRWCFEFLSLLLLKYDPF